MKIELPRSAQVVVVKQHKVTLEISPSNMLALMHAAGYPEIPASARVEIDREGYDEGAWGLKVTWLETSEELPGTYTMKPKASQ